MTTKMQWTDISLSSSNRERVAELLMEVKRCYGLISEKKGRRPTGLCSLFYGPSQTDKRNTASLLGKEAGLEVYNISLPGIVSKYIGETEKNIDRVFSRARDQKWILFFDEADALFGRETEAADDQGSDVNMALHYLLQRIEKFNGLAILSSNTKDNIEEKTTARFHFLIHFPAQ